MREETAMLKKAVISWLDTHAESLTIQGVTMTPKEAKKHVLKATPEGEEILDMVAKTAVGLFMRGRAEE